MDDVVQYRKVLEIEYLPDTEKMRIYHQGGEARYVNVDFVKLSPELVKMDEVIFKKTSSKIRFLEPINCNIIIKRYEAVMECGVKLSEGSDPRKLVEKISGDMTSEAKPIWEMVKEHKESQN